MLIRRHRARLAEFDHAREGVPDYQAGDQGAAADATAPDGSPSEEWTVAQLRDHAKANGVNLAGATSKADILKALQA